MERRATQDGKTSFCKIIHPDQSTNPLCIPPQFVEEPISSKGVTLKGPSGTYQQVKPFKRGTHMYLGHGWVQFARDNSLGNNELLVFNHNGAAHFDVEIFDPDGCERINVVTTTRKTSPESMSKPRNKHNDQEHRLKKKESQRERIKEEEMDPAPTKKKESQRVRIKEEMDPAPTKKKGRPKRTFSPLPVPVPFTSDLPYFWMQMGVNQVERVFMLPIPDWFSEAYLTGDKIHITLLNRDEKSWEVNCIPTSNKRLLSGGWSHFVRHNKLKTGDICVFELVGCNKMQVHVFPSEEESD